MSDICMYVYNGSHFCVWGTAFFVSLLGTILIPKDGVMEIGAWLWTGFMGYILLYNMGACYGWF